MHRNPYAARLQEFSSFVFNDEEAFRQSGRWADFFASRIGRAPARLIVEIGCSNVEFLASIAQASPEVAFVGIDWKFKVLYKGAKKVDLAGLKNVALLRVRAQELGKIFGAGELDEIWTFFPDPWAKRSQLKHRLMQESFLLDAHRALKPGGVIHFKTDHPGYFQWVLALFGVPEPELPAYDAPNPEARSYRLKQVLARRLEDKESLPEPNPKLQCAFAVEHLTTDYWAVGGTRPPALYRDTQTLFEKGFVRDELSIYALQLHKK